MQTNLNELFAVRFANCMGTLVSLGLKVEVAVVGGLVMISAADKHSASGFRKAVKTACAKTQTIFTETRPAKGFYVFTIAA